MSNNDEQGPPSPFSRLPPELLGRIFGETVLSVSNDALLSTRSLRMIAQINKDAGEVINDASPALARFGGRVERLMDAANRLYDKAMPVGRLPQAEDFYDSDWHPAAELTASICPIIPFITAARRSSFLQKVVDLEPGLEQVCALRKLALERPYFKKNDYDKVVGKLFDYAEKGLDKEIDWSQRSLQKAKAERYLDDNQTERLNKLVGEQRDAVPPPPNSHLPFDVEKARMGGDIERAFKLIESQIDRPNAPIDHTAKRINFTHNQARAQLINSVRPREGR